jgi:hypothetical protein
MPNWLNVRLKRAGRPVYESPILMELRQLGGRAPIIGETIDIPFEGKGL